MGGYRLAPAVHGWATMGVAAAAAPEWLVGGIWQAVANDKKLPRKNFSAESSFGWLARELKRRRGWDSCQSRRACEPRGSLKTTRAATERDRRLSELTYCGIRARDDERSEPDRA